MKRILNLSSALLVTGLIFSGCKKVFDIKPQDQLDQSQAYQNVYDADGGYLWKIYGTGRPLCDPE
jgi:starch-binding outer membrane protein, SusD/RagB family